MTTHELARHLLQGPDLPAVVRASGSDSHLGFIQVDKLKEMRETYVIDWIRAKYPTDHPNKNLAGKTADWYNPQMTAGDVIAILG